MTVTDETEPCPSLIQITADKKLIARLFNRTAVQGAIATFLVAIAGLAAQFQGLRVLGSIRPDYIPMAPSTACCFLVLSVAVFGYVHKKVQSLGGIVLAALTFFVLCFGIMESIQPWMGIELEDFFIPQQGMLGEIPVGRMSPVTGAGIVLAALGTLLLLQSRRLTDSLRFRNWAMSMGMLILLLGATVLLAYIYGTPLMYGSRTVPMAGTTAFAFVFLGIAMSSAAGSDCVLMRFFIGHSTSARLSRVFLPLTVGAVFFVILTSHFISLSFPGQDALFLAILIVVVAMVTVSVVMRVAHLIGRDIDSLNKQLQESEESLSITLHSIGDAVIATDTEGRVTKLNPTAERLTGWKLEDARGRQLVEVFRIVNFDTREAVADPVQLVLKHGQVVGLANHTVLLACDGNEYQIADSAAPIRNAANEIVGVVLVFSPS